MVGRRDKTPPLSPPDPQVRLRTEYRETLNSYTRDVVRMCELARYAMLHASRALIEQDLEGAENAMNESDKILELHQRCEDRALDLLARQNPVATDLRQVLAYINIERDITRMGNLAKLVAKVARQHHPEPAFSEEIFSTLALAAHTCDHMAGNAAHLIVAPKVAAACDLATQDEAVDSAARGLVRLAMSENWQHGNRAAVEAALVSRYYERYADHCVGIGRHIVFMVTGMRPGEQLDALDADDGDRFAELERRFSLRD